MSQDWRAELAEILAAGPATDRFAALATVDADGQPRARMVVLRALLEDPLRLRFTADGRSAKLAQLAREPRAELCWYPPSRWVQFRLTGPIHRLASGPEAQALWDALTRDTRAQFFGGPPAAPFGGPSPAGDPADARPPASFAVLDLTVEAVDVVDLRQPPARRTAWRLGPEGWQATRLNP